MSKFKNASQKGFSAIEALLILIIVGGLGFVGWYVVHSNQKTEDQVSNIDKSAVKTTSAVKSSKQKFVFKELSVQITLPSELKGLSYEVQSGMLPSDRPFGFADLTTPRFTELASVCWKHDPTGARSFATIQKKDGKYGIDGFEGTNLKQFDGFYIGENTLPSYTCEDGATKAQADEFAQLGQSLNSALIRAFKTAEEVK